MAAKLTGIYGADKQFYLNIEFEQDPPQYGGCPCDSGCYHDIDIDLTEAQAKEIYETLREAFVDDE